MTTFKPGDKVRRVGSSARWGIWLRNPVVTVRAIDPNGPLLFHGLGGWYRPEPFELVPEQVKLDPDKWTHEQGTHYSQVRTTNPSPMVMAMWVLTELAREGCLAWFGNSAKPEPETVMVPMPRNVVEYYAAGHGTALADGCRKALEDGRA